MAVAVAALVAGCAAKPTFRALDPAIRNVYLPIFETQIYEPGLEEQVTQRTIDEFLIDGRLRVTRPEQADVVLVGRLTGLESIADTFRDDDFALLTRIEATARVTAYGADDPERRHPVFIWDGITSEFLFVSDKRFVVDVLDVDARNLLMEQLAKEIVRVVMEEEPTYTIEVSDDQIEALDDPGPAFRTYESLRDRRKRRSGVAPLRTAF